MRLIECHCPLLSAALCCGILPDCDSVGDVPAEPLFAVAVCGCVDCSVAVFIAPAAVGCALLHLSRSSGVSRCIGFKREA